MTSLLVALLARALGRPGVFRKIKVHMNRLQIADGTGGDRILCLNHRRQIVPVPEQEFHVIALNRLDEPVAFGEAGGHRFVGDHVQPGVGCAHREGLGRQLYPQLDLWKTAHPILRQWMEEQVGPRAAIRQLREDLPQIRESLRELPGIVRYLSGQIENERRLLEVGSPELASIRDLLRRQHRHRKLR